MGLYAKTSDYAERVQQSTHLSLTGPVDGDASGG